MSNRPMASGIILLGAVGLLLSAALPGARPARGQNYRFSVPEMKMLVTVQNDGSVLISYDITFRNQPWGHPIDVVDIGTPDERYDLGRVRASVGEMNLREIRPSTYIDCGFEVHLGRATIPPGGQGTLHVAFPMPERVYQDTTRHDYASLRITPTWFDPQCVVGTTHLQVAVQLPESVQPEEVLHQGLNFTSKASTDRGALVGWDFGQVRLDRPHMVALSFPKRDLTHVVVKTRWQMLVEWFAATKPARWWAYVIYAVLLGVLFFRFSGGTGVSVYVVLLVVSGVVFVASPTLHLLSLPAVVVLLGLNEWYLARRRPSYLPPIAQVEGGGIKRGLTAPEAAALLELPMSRVLGLVIFGMLKKGILRQVQADPLVVEPTEDFRVPEEARAGRTQRAKFYRRAGQRRGIVVHRYEYPFIYLIQCNPGKPVSQIDFSTPLRLLLLRVAQRMRGFDLSDTREYDFSTPLRLLLLRVAQRMRGFDLSDTREYYRSIVRRAVQQAGALADIAQREKYLDRTFEWILMDDDYPTVFTAGRPYVPVWVRGGGTPVGSGGRAAAPSTPAGSTSFGDVAASFAGWAENTMGSLASAISPGSLGVQKPGGGILDLSGADHVTGEFFHRVRLRLRMRRWGTLTNCPATRLLWDYFQPACRPEQDSDGPGMWASRP